MKEVSYKDLKFNPLNLIGGEWMLMTERVLARDDEYLG